MPRQQTQRLNKTPTTEVELGKTDVGITGVTQMPTVTPEKTSGTRLADALGMAIKQGVKT